MSYVLSLDAGTSSVRAFLYDLNGEVKSVSSLQLEHDFPHSGWIEFDGEALWQKTLTVIKNVITDACIEVKDIQCIGMTNQRESVLMWDKDSDRLLGPALSWQDRRTDTLCEQLDLDVSLVSNKTGLTISPYFSASKLRWMLDNYPEANDLLSQKKLLVGTVDSFLIWRLTGGGMHVTDITNASRTLLMNIDSGQWDSQLLTMFGIDKSILPDILDSDASFGVTKEWLFGAEIPITGVMGDQQASLFGQQCFKAGMAKVTYGTGGFLLINSGISRPKVSASLLTTVAYKVDSQCHYALEGCMYAAGSILRWFKDKLSLFDDYQQMEEMLSTTVDNGSVYLIPAFMGLGSPHWNNHVKAAFFGIGLETNKQHMIRAGLESIVYQTREQFDVMNHENLVRPISVAVDGGVSQSDWMLTYLANCLQLPIRQSARLEMSCFGAFLIAAKGHGIYNLCDFAKFNQESDKFFKPQRDSDVMPYYLAWHRYLASYLQEGSHGKRNTNR